MHHYWTAIEPSILTFGVQALTTWGVQ